VYNSIVDEGSSKNLTREQKKGQVQTNEKQINLSNTMWIQNN